MTDHLAQETLVQLMVAAAAADGSISDTELREVSSLIALLPVFQGFDRSRMAAVAERCGEILSREEGFEAIIEDLKTKLPVRLYETAYALAVEVISSDIRATQAELRLLEMLRDAFDMDRLTSGAIEHSARVRYRTLD